MTRAVCRFAFPCFLVGVLGCHPPEETPGLESPDKRDNVPVLESFDQVVELVREVSASSYPELADAEIVVDTMNTNGSYTMTARPDIGSILNPFEAITYRIRVNEALFTKGAGSPPPLPLEAARSVVAHELAHIAFYTGGPLELLQAAWTQVHGPAQVVFERRTDFDALRRGYGPGLSLYRQWLYPQLSGETLTRKREVYFTPEEIAALMLAIEEVPALVDIWLEDPPLTLAEIEAAIPEAKRGELPIAEPTCQADEFGCFDGSCVALAARCDQNSYDCPANEDELGCENSACGAGQFSCASRQCVAAFHYCDGTPDCADGSDESDCPTQPSGGI